MSEAFPSPCGDELKCTLKVYVDKCNAFPSPCGDKLK